MDFLLVSNLLLYEPPLFISLNSNLTNYVDVTDNKNSFVNSGSAFVYSKTGNKVCVQCFGSVNSDVIVNAILCSNFPAPAFGYSVLSIIDLSTGESGSCLVNASGQLINQYLAVGEILKSGHIFVISGSYICKID